MSKIRLQALKTGTKTYGKKGATASKKLATKAYNDPTIRSSARDVGTQLALQSLTPEGRAQLRQSGVSGVGQQFATNVATQKGLLPPPVQTTTLSPQVLPQPTVLPPPQAIDTISTPPTAIVDMTTSTPAGVELAPPRKSVGMRFLYGLLNSVNPIRLLNLFLWPIVFLGTLFALRFTLYMDITDDWEAYLESAKGAGLATVIASFLINIPATLIFG